MQSVSTFRCLNHSSREAAARCLQCGHYFCRECVTEHDGRLVCAGCLKSVSRTNRVKSFLIRNLFSLTCYSIFALLLSWYFFYTIGRLLVRIPSAFASLIS